MVSGFLDFVSSQNKVHHAVQKHPRRDELLRHAMRFYDSKQAINCKELAKIINRFKVNMDAQELQGVFAASGTTSGLTMFDLLSILLPRDQAKQKWKEFTVGAQAKPPAFVDGQSRDNTARVQPRSVSCDPSIIAGAPSRQGHNKTLVELEHILRQKVCQWCLANLPSGVTLYEALRTFADDFGSGEAKPFVVGGGHNAIPQGAALGIDQKTFATAMQRLAVPASQAQITALFQRFDEDRDQRLNFREFGKAMLPGLDRSTPKWLTRKDLPSVAPLTAWEDERLAVTWKPGQRDLAPIPNPAKSQHNPRSVQTSPSSNKVKWGIDFIQNQASAPSLHRPKATKQMPGYGGYNVMTHDGTLQPPTDTTSLPMFKKGGPKAGPRPRSVEGPPAQRLFPKGSSVDPEKKHFWHEWHWRNERVGRLAHRLDKLPGGALRVGHAEIFSWPPTVLPL